MATNMPWWEKENFNRRRPYLAARQAILRALRRFFEDAGFDEVETPALQVSPGMEPHLRVFKTGLEEPFEASARPLYLHTSPEFAMKKLLAAGMPKIFQVARVWRNGERSDLHHPEFTMVEWYRAGAGYGDLMDDSEGLVRAAATAAGAKELTHGNRRCDPFGLWERLSVQDAFARYAGIDLLATIATPGDPEPDPAALAAEARRIGVEPGPEDRWEDIFFRVMLDRIEPRLGEGRPTILYDYPLCLAALARPKPDDPGLAERFELYA
ncbi:MAG: EF-P lysine aminoacylase GenX, partial [Rhodospirillales bacterium]|nr:EF-P lysine aminoacylase GenX [Rhodospirillales bacterium]